MQVTGETADSGLLHGELLPSSGLRLQVPLCQGRAASRWEHASLICNSNDHNAHTQRKNFPLKTF